MAGTFTVDIMLPQIIVIFRCVQLAGFFSNVILANSELTAFNGLQVRKQQPLTAINGH